MIDIHTHQVYTDTSILSIVNHFADSDTLLPHDYFSIGWHPWSIIPEKSNEILEKMQSILMHQNCLAVGEIGLDKCCQTPWDWQIAAFEQQLSLVQKYQKPIIIHCVKAYQEIIFLLKKHSITTPVIFHGYNKSLQLAQQIWQQGYYISFGNALLHSAKLQNIWQQAPQHLLFLETDTANIDINSLYEIAQNCVEYAVLPQILTNFEAVFNKKIKYGKVARTR